MRENEFIDSTNPAAILLRFAPDKMIGDAVFGTPYEQLDVSVSKRKMRLFALACFHGEESWADWEASPDDKRGYFSSWDGARFAAGMRVGQADPGSLTMEERIERATILRDIFGNPFRPLLPFRKHEPHRTSNGDPAHGCEMCDGDDVCTCPRERRARCKTCGGRWPECQSAKPAWITPLVLDLARSCYDNPLQDGSLDQDRLLVLSDAIDEAGCDSQYFLNPLRGLRMHSAGADGFGWRESTVKPWRGLHPLDVILGLE